MRSQVCVELASDLKEKPTLEAPVGVSLFLMDPLVLCKISCRVVSSRALIA